jgi:hypothetical protein
MTPEVAFKLYLATRLHFLTKYDVFKSNGKFKGQDKVIDRKDLYLVNQISKNKSERDFIELCVANFLYGNDKFLYEPVYAEDNYEHWLKVKQSIGYTLERDLSYIELQLMKRDMSLNDYLRDRVISDLLSRKVEYESIIMLNRKIEVIDKISGFDSDKYKVRMHKSNKFVTKGTLADKHSSHIDNFLSNVN